MNSITDGCYCGHNSIRKAFLEDTFETMIAGRVHKVPRWALNTINPDLRNQANLAEANLRAQFDKVHGNATLKSGNMSTTPATDFINRDGTQTPIIAVRVYHGGAQQVMMILPITFIMAL